MAGMISRLGHGGARRISVNDPPWVRRLLIGIALLYLGLMLFVPLGAVFWEASRKGLAAFGQALVEPDALAAIQLTLLTAAIAVPLNLVFGVSAAWAVLMQAASSSQDRCFMGLPRSW